MFSRQEHGESNLRAILARLPSYRGAQIHRMKKSTLFGGATNTLLACVGLTAVATSQQCYRVGNQCFAFAPPPGEIPDDKRMETGLELRSNRLRLTGDVRLRLRAAETERKHPYNANDQQATRARAQLDFEVNDKVRAFLEFNYSETWAGSASYSDALGGAANNPNFDGVSQAFFEAEDMFGFGEKWRIGRSQFILGNGLILGSCDFLQRPGVFTGGWLSRNFWGHDLEVFVLDDYGPLQSTNAGTRYFGASAKIVLSGKDDAASSAEPPTNDSRAQNGLSGAQPSAVPLPGPGSSTETSDGPRSHDGFEIDSIRPYFFKGTHDGYVQNKDTWLGVNTNGYLPWSIEWMAEFAHRLRFGAKDVSAYRLQLAKNLDLFDGVFSRASLIYTDSQGPLHINPADFNTAGLLHQYGGAWRSDLSTTQLGLVFTPGAGFNIDTKFMLLDRRGASPQQGDFEADVLVNKMLESGVHVAVGYGVDNDVRQVAYLQMTLYF